MPNRRDALSTLAALPVMSTANAAAPKPLRLLILGGTGFTGPHQVRYALSRGHKITLFNRGRRPKDWPAEVEELVGDRDTGDYKALAGREFDVCIDNPTSVPFWVRDAADALAGRIKHYVFISTMSVYADDSQPGQDEDAPRHRYTGPDAMAETNASLRKNMALYGPLKAACEDEVLRRFGAQASTLIRPGLIVGPGDETDRFSYWPLRLRQGGAMLVPPRQDPVKFIDARDLAEWTVRMAEQRAAGAFNGFGPANELSMGSLLEQMRTAIGSQARFVEASRAFLAEHKVAPWVELPLWLPGEGATAGFHRRSNARAVAAGLSFRPAAETARDLLAWWDSLDATRRSAPLRAGLKPEREAELLRLLAAA